MRTFLSPFYLQRQKFLDAKTNLWSQFVLKTYQYLWMRGKNEAGTNTSICMQTTMNYTLAASPAFEIEGLSIFFIKKIKGV